jgi:hypothetical protein
LGWAGFFNRFGNRVTFTSCPEGELVDSELHPSIVEHKRGIPADILLNVTAKRDSLCAIAGFNWLRALPVGGSESPQIILTHEKTG